jgi:hypothetical protein
MFQTKFVEKDRTYILCSISFVRISCRLRDNTKEYGRYRQATDHNLLWCMRIASWIIKAINTHSEYVIIIACPLRQWLRERTSVLRYMHIACLGNVVSHSVAVPCLTKEWSVIYQQSTDFVFCTH